MFKARLLFWLLQWSAVYLQPPIRCKAPFLFLVERYLVERNRRQCLIGIEHSCGLLSFAQKLLVDIEPISEALTASSNVRFGMCAWKAPGTLAVVGL